jgi:ferrous-iron efflux pump FieF
MSHLSHATLLRSVSYASFGLSILFIALKTWAWMATESVSLQASLVDSLVDSMASFVNLIAIQHALKPADEEHRFGHGKIEAIAAQGQSIFIGGTAVWVMFEAFHRLFHPQAITETTLGIWVLSVNCVAALALVTFQRYVVRKTHSTAVKADSLHYQTDLYLNLSVIAALFLTQYWNLPMIDAIFGLGIGFYISYTSWKIAKEAFDILVDRELPDDDRLKIEHIIKNHPEVRGFHDLKTRSAGQYQFIQLHLELDPNMSLAAAHQISITLMEEIKKIFPRADIMVHEDPFDDRSIH